MSSSEVERLCLRGEEAWVPFLERYADVVYRAAQRATSDPDEARNLAADVLERMRADWPEVLRSFLASARGERADFSVWLAVVARRLAIDCLRSRYGRRTVPAGIRRAAPWLRRAWRLRVVEERPLEEVWSSLRSLEGAPPSVGELALEIAPYEGPQTPTGMARAKPPGLGEFEPASAPSPAASGGREQLSKVLAKLSGDDRLLLRLYFLEGASAEALRRLHGSATRSQVYNRIHTLLGKIRVQLESQGLSMEDLGDPREIDVGGWLGSPKEEGGAFGVSGVRIRGSKMSETHELQFLLESARGQGTAADRARWNALVATDGELRSLERLVSWLGTGPTWDDNPDDEEHLDPMVIARCAENTELLFREPGVLAHLGRCDECLELFEAALAERTHREETGPSGVVRVGPWIAAAASILFLVAMVWLRGLDDDDGWSARALAQVEPLPVRTLRSPATEAEFDLAYAKGLEHYAAGDYALASTELERAIGIDPSRPEARLYFGSALLLEGNAERARIVLRPATDATVVAGIRDEALWVLAQACLYHGEPEAAIGALERRSATAARHLEATREQLDALRSAVTSARGAQQHERRPERRMGVGALSRGVLVGP